MSADDAVSRRFVSATGLLLVAGALGQVISFLGTLVTTRLYRPSDFGTYALLVAVLLPVVVFVTGRYDVAIVTEGRDRDAASSSTLVLALGVAGAVLTLSALACAELPLARDVVPHNVRRGLWSLPALVLLSAVGAAGSSAATRTRSYRALATFQVATSAATVAGQIVLADVVPGANGLILGFLVGQLAADLVVAKPLLAQVRHFLLQQDRLSAIWAAAVRSRQYPMFVMPYSFVAQLYHQLPQVLIGVWFGSAPAGHYGLTMRLLYTPMALLPLTTGQVVFTEMARTPGDRGWSKRMAASTGVTGTLLAPAVAAVLIAGPGLFALLAGEPWRPAGEYGRLVVLAGFLTALTAGYDRVFDVTARQQLRLGLMVGMTIALAASATATGVLGTPVETFLVVLAATKSALSIVWMSAAFRVCGSSQRALALALLAIMLAVSAWFLVLQALDLAAVIDEITRLRPSI